MAKSAKSLGFFISSLPRIPNEQVGKKVTEDQLQEIDRLRNIWYWMGRCFKAHFSDQNNPFDSGEVRLDPPQFEEMILARTDSYISLWGLIQVGFKAIKAEAEMTGNEFPFIDAQMLFKSIVAYDADYSVRGIFESYKENSTERLRKSIEHFQKGTTNPLPHTKAASDMRDGLMEIKKNRERGWSYWDEYIVLWLISRALQRPNCPRKKLIQKHFKACTDANTEVMEHMKTGLRRRGKWAKVYYGSYAWKNGEKLPAQKGGIYRKAD